jgi:hypothetical protein
MTDQEKLKKIHNMRMLHHWGENAPHSPCPITDSDWRQTTHGAPWDSNVAMAK